MINRFIITGFFLKKLFRVPQTNAMETELISILKSNIS